MSRARCGTEACRWAASAELRVDPRSQHHRDRLRGVPRSSQHHRRERRAAPAHWPISKACFPISAPRWWAIPVTGEAYLLLDAAARIRRLRSSLASSPTGRTSPPMPTPMSAIRDRVPEVLERAEATLQVLKDIVAKIPDSLDRSEPVLHDRRAHRAGEQPAGAERRFADVLRDDERAVRADDLRDRSGDRHARHAGHARRRGACSDQGRRSCRDQSGRARRGRADRRSRPTISGARCRRSATRSNSCAISRGSSRSSRSPWSTVPVPRR